MTKRYFLLFILFFSHCLVAFHDDPAFSKLLTTLEISPNQPKTTIAISMAQQFLKNGERYTFAENYNVNRDKILPLLEELNFFRSVHASRTKYDYAVVLGSLYQSVVRRIAFLIEEWERGVRFKEVIFLTGDRPLHPEKEPFPLKNETEMMVMVWEETQMPSELHDLPITIIHTSPTGWNDRPTTTCTVNAWKKTNPNPGACLVFSCQPFVHYQGAILESLMPSSFKIETVGPEGGRSLPTSVLLDNVSRCLFWKL